MFGRWIKHLTWHPFEMGCRRWPLVPLHATVTQPVDGITSIRIDNFVTRALSRFGGGYDYSVCYWVDQTLLVDTGFPWARRCLRKTLLNLRVHDVLKEIVNTHYHEDHVGNNDLLTELTKAKIYAHPLAIPEIRFPGELPWYRRFLFGPAECGEVQPAPDQISTPRFHFDVLHMPGHCPGHVCLFEPEKRWLISGDLYISADLDSQLTDADGPAWIESLNRAIDLKPNMLFDAHGVIIEGPDTVHTLLTRKRDFLVEIGRRAQAAATHARSLREITRQVFDQRNWVDCLSMSDGWLSLLTGSEFSRGNVVKTFLRAQAAARPPEPRG